MNQLLQQVKSVPGVSGVLVLDRVNATTYQLLPASFSVEVIKNLAVRLKEIATNWPDLSQTEIKFESGYSRLFQTRSTVVLILTKVDIYFPDLNLILKSVLPQIEKKISKANPFQEVEQDQVYALNRVNVDLLVTATNLVAAKYRDRMGAYQVTQILRKAKDKILNLFPYLTNFYVDNQARIAFLKSRQEIDQSKIQEAFANWIYNFKAYCEASAPGLPEMEIRELTSELKGELAKQGFYHHYETLTVG